MPLTQLQHYSYRGARAMVILHEQEMRKFMVTWRAAKAAEAKLPYIDDLDHESTEHLLLRMPLAA